MPHCTKCGAAIADNASFCASCGAPQSAANPIAAPPVSSVAPTQQMAENIAGLLCYVLGWITGLIFYFVDKRPYVRFHAAQSIVVFGGLHIIEIILGMFFGVGMFMSGLSGFSMARALSEIVGLVVFVLWILLMVKAYQGERFRVPIAADVAEKIFGKP
ncbi:MAG TPA: DUF4870 domain-containing protein [Candidatus Acidoferrales bacterium]|nr:DUF4870 domain-containing protein [Candidatus Acidoferrales bacterium]